MQDYSGEAGTLLTKAQEDYAAANTPTPSSTTYSTTSTGEVRTPDATGWMGVPYALPGGTTQTTSLTADQLAAQQQAAQRSTLQKGIQKLVGDALGVYDSLYGSLGQAAAGQKRQLEEQFGREEAGLQQQFSQEMPRIGTAYAGRGAYDSSWRINAEQAAANQFKGQLENLGAERFGQMAALGQKVKEQEAQFKVGQDALNRVLAELGTTTDVEKLTALQTDIQKRISELQAQQATLQAPEAFVSTFQGIGGPSSRAGQVKATIDNILAGAAAPELKQNVAAGFIQSSGLTDQEKNDLVTYLNTAIDRMVTPATTAPTA